MVETNFYGSYRSTRISTTTTMSDTSSLRLRSTSISVRSEKRKMVRRSATMTSQRLRRSSISLARNIGSGLYSLKETLMTSSMQDISEGSSLGQASTFYVTDSEDMTEDENDNIIEDNKATNHISSPMHPSNSQSESDNISDLFKTER
jgi:hypothetical protein